MKTELLRTTALPQLAPPRTGGGDRRRELPASLPNASKRERDGAEPWRPPANVRGLRVELTDDLRAYTRRKLGMKLGKFADFIERVSVRVEDVNGPRRGVDHECRVKVVLTGMPSVVAIERDAVPVAAIDRAVAAAAEATRGAVQRRRKLPVRRCGTRR